MKYRLNGVLAEQNKTGRWLVEILEKNKATVFRWCTNEYQPSLETLVEIAKLLKIDAKELLVSTKN